MQKKLVTALKSLVAELVECKECGVWIETKFGEDEPSKHQDASGTKDDPRAPGDRDDICDVCEWGDK